MGYDMWDAQNDAAWDEMQERIAEELYPDHRDRAIGEFSEERLRSYYVKNRRVMCPAIQIMSEGKRLLEGGHHAAAVVFYGGAIELLLKATILKPVVAGLVHMESVAELIMDSAVSREAQYLKLLKPIFRELVHIDMGQITRPGVAQTLWEECSTVRRLRNSVVHEGASQTKEQAEFTRDVALAVLKSFVFPVFVQLGLTLTQDRTGELCDA